MGPPERDRRGEVFYPSRYTPGLKIDRQADVAAGERINYTLMPWARRIRSAEGVHGWEHLFRRAYRDGLAWRRALRESSFSEIAGDFLHWAAEQDELAVNEAK